jgi:hypothetical protein
MLGAGRYLLGVAEILALSGFATLGGVKIRQRLLPGFSGPPAWLATAIVALGILIWVAELLGTLGLFKPVPYLVGVVVVGAGTWALGRGSCRRGGVASLALRSAPGEGTESGSGMEPRPPQTPRGGTPPHPDTTRGSGVSLANLIGLAVAAVAVIHFVAGIRLRLSTGMTGFDSTWYHGPFAAGFFQSGDTWNLHFIAPQFLAWFYPANGEIFHAVGMLAFGRDALSPLLNLGWFIGCLLAAWCIGRPYRVAPWSLALGAIALSVPALSDQAGEARNDIVGIFFLLAAVAVAVNAWEARPDRRLSTGALLVVGLAAGLAAGAKLNFLLPAAALVIGLAAIAPKGARWRALAASGFAALAGGGYWYLRNLVHTGNPLPWVHHLGPIALPAPAQALGGREAHSILGYLTDGSVWSGWLLPGLHDGLWLFWPLLLVLALAGLLLCLGRGAGPLLRVAGIAGLAAAVAWLIAPTSASGPAGMPRGFESGLRYLAPALVLGLTLLPAAPQLRDRLSRWASLGPHRTWSMPTRAWAGLAVAVAIVAVAFGYREQRGYLEHRYADPGFTTQGLDAAFKWANSLSNARIATTSTRQYPLFGTDLSNHVQFVGLPTPHGGFVAPATCRAWRKELNEGHYDYVVVSRDRIEPGRPAYRPAVPWTEAPGAAVVLRKPPTVVFRLTGPLDPSSCRR